MPEAPVINGPAALPLLLGRWDDGSDWWVDLAEACHTVCQGVTRSGKSTLAYTAVGQACLLPSVLVTGVDPTRLLLGPLAGLAGAPLRAVGPSSRRHVAVLDELVAEMDRRLDLLVARRIDKLTAFTPSVPLLLVVLEEWPGVLAMAKADDDAEGRKPADRLTPKLERSMLRLSAEGAKVGVRLLVLLQRAEAAVLSGYARAQLARRITLRADNSASVELLHADLDRATLAQVLTFDPGYALVEAPGIARQVVRADVTSYAAYLATVEGAAGVLGEAQAEGRGASPLGLFLRHSISEAP